MERIVPIILLWLSACSGEPLSEAIRRRSVYGVYADDFADEYEPVAVAAFPLHQPVPVLRLLSSPSHPAPSYSAPSYHHQPPARPSPATSYTSISYAPPKRSVPRYQPPRERDQYVYATTDPEYTYSYEDSYEQPYAPSASHKYTKYSSPSYEEYDAPAPVVVYARPNKNGGYSYRQKPRPQTKPQEPVIIRVHKYKIVRD